MEYLIKALVRIPEIEIYRVEKERVSTICFNVNDIKSSEVVERLSKKDICVRGGIHCAILAHETLGTVKTGAIRVSLNSFNTKKEIKLFINALEEIIADVSNIL